MISNIYATIAEFQAWLTERAQTINTDVNDDAVMASVLQSTSRFVDRETNRDYYPRYETLYFDVPAGTESNTTSFSGRVYGSQNRQLILTDELLELITLTNGDGTVIPSSAYNLIPYNESPKNCIEIIQSQANYYWKQDAGMNWQGVISVAGVWGYRNKYNQRAWSLGGTLGAAMSDTSSLTATMTADHNLVSNQVWRIGTEILQGTVNVNALTFNARGDNGSTPATHLINAPVYYWNPQEEIKDAVLEIAQNIYSSRSGQSSAGRISVTAGGVVIRPENVPDTVGRTLKNFRRIGL
jgi:hypothetical protein